LDVLRGEDVDHLAGDAEDRVQRLRLEQRSPEVDRDHDVGAHRAGHVDGQVVGEPAVDEQAILQAQRLDDAGDRHAGAHCGGQLALAQYDRLAADEVGRDRAEGNRQIVEALKAPDLAEPTQHAFELDARHRSLGQQNVTAAQADLDRSEIGRIVALQPNGPFFARRQSRKSSCVDIASERVLHVVDRDAGSERPAHDRSHARAGEAVDRDSQLLKHLQDPDVRRASRAPARQHQTDSGALAIGLAAAGTAGGDCASEPTAARISNEAARRAAVAVADVVDIDCVNVALSQRGRSRTGV
jgi:hypothetical protein